MLSTTIRSHGISTKIGIAIALGLAFGLIVIVADELCRLILAHRKLSPIFQVAELE